MAAQQQPGAWSRLVSGCLPPSHVRALMVSFQGNPLYFQSARNVTVNILNEKTKVLTRLVTGKEGERLRGVVKTRWKRVCCGMLRWLPTARRRGAQVSCEVQMKTLLYFVETKLETWKLCWRGSWLVLSDNEADHRFHLKANPEAERLVVRLQGQEEHMQADISVITGRIFLRVF